jgi:hypothetical protein
MSSDYQVLHKHVYYFPGIIKNINELLLDIENFESNSISKWETWYANSDPDSPEYGVLKTFNTSLLKNELDEDKKLKAKSIMFSILEPMEEAAREYLTCHSAPQEEVTELKRSLFEDPMPYAIRKYNPEESMGPHTDRFYEDKNAITIAVYLNSDYEGGQISIVEPGVEVSIKTEPGSVVIFPSNYLHESGKLSLGQKMMITHVHTTQKKIMEF